MLFLRIESGVLCILGKHSTIDYILSCIHTYAHIYIHIHVYTHRYVHVYMCVFWQWVEISYGGFDLSFLTICSFECCMYLLVILYILWLYWGFFPLSYICMQDPCLHVSLRVYGDMCMWICGSPRFILKYFQYIIEAGSQLNPEPSDEASLANQVTLGIVGEPPCLSAIYIGSGW